MVAVSGQVIVAVACWMCCSMGMLVFNKLAITVFPEECTLVALQMASACVALGVLCRSSLRIGSMHDVIRWCAVVPFFTGMLLTSILALKGASMSLVICFRALSPIFAMVLERLHPNPPIVTGEVLATLGLMLLSALLYTHDMPQADLSGIGWVVLNNIFAICDRLLQRLMLAKDQNPVDMSMTGVTFLNNFLGMFPVAAVAALTSEYSKVPDAFAALTPMGTFFVVASCIVGVAISYTGVWVQSQISATSFLVLVNANKFVIIIAEAVILGSKTLGPWQVAGASLAVFSGMAFGQAKSRADEQQRRMGESSTLLHKKGQV